MISMADIAKKAGVSRSTASVVLNGRGTEIGISAQTHRRVLEAAEEMGYRRNDLARAVVTGKNFVLGFLDRGPHLEQKSRILEGVLEEADQAGYFVKVLPYNREKGFQEVARRCLEQRLAGIILRRPEPVEVTGLHEELLSYQMPMVTVDDDQTFPWASSVTSDDASGCRLSVDHLLGLGHRKIALLLSAFDQTQGGARRAAYTQALADHGICVPEEWVLEHRYLRALAAQRVTTLFQSREECPTALICEGDEYAAVAISALRRLGLSVPEDVSVVGYSDLSYAALLDPPLTTVSQNFEEIGRAAVRRLLDDINGDGGQDRSPNLLIPTALVVRQSTAPARR